jgi:hypothetical protein
MKWIILVFFSLVSAQSGNCQGYINLKKENIKDQFQKYCERQNLRYSVAEKDSSLILSIIADSSVLPVDFVCLFNKKGKCVEETVKVCCDKCFDKFLEPWLGPEKSKLHALDSANYISGPGKSILLSIIDSNTFSVKYLRPWEYLAAKKAYRKAKRKE